MELRKVNIPKLVVTLVIPFLAAAVGSVFTSPSIPTWYAGLVKPAFSPPNWLFGPVWTILYLLMGISLYMIWSRGLKKKGVKVAMYLFLAQLALNSLWSILFFGLQSPMLAFGEIVVLWIFILATILKFYPISRNAGLLLVPYILWVSFAAFLNLNILLLNM